MDDSDTATITLTREEGRDAINALTNYEIGVSGREAERALNVRELLKREFGFEEESFEGDRDLLAEWANSFESDRNEHEIELSGAEADEVVAALADHEARAETDEEAIASVRLRFEETFGVEAD